MVFICTLTFEVEANVLSQMGQETSFPGFCFFLMSAPLDLELELELELERELEPELELELERDRDLIL